MIMIFLRYYLFYKQSRISKQVCLPTLDTLELKKDKYTDYVLRWKSKRLYNSKRKHLYTPFLHSIKLSKYRVGIKFDKDPLNNHNFKFKNCLLGSTNLVKNSD